MPRPPNYCVYLLRFWEETSQLPNAPGVWRFSLEDPHTGERRGFISVEELAIFLRRQMSARQASNSTSAEHDK